MWMVRASPPAQRGRNPAALDIELQRFVGIAYGDTDVLDTRDRYRRSFSRTRARLTGR